MRMMLSGYDNCVVYSPYAVRDFMVGDSQQLEILRI